MRSTSWATCVCCRVIADVGRKAKPIITIDCETDPFKRGRVPVPFLWGMYDGERYRRFDDAASLLRYLMAIDCVVYAHNGGKFDYQFILDFMEPWTDITIINGRLAKFKIGNAEFRDSWNILPVPLKTFGKDEMQFWKLEPEHRAAHMAEIERYNARDCRELWEAVTAFRATYGNGLTLAGSALSFWSKTFNEEKPKSDAAFYHRMAPYYYGGRVQCFRKGTIAEPFDVVDINSAYPYAMSHNHPVSVAEDTCYPKASDPIIPQSLYTIGGVSRGALPWRSSSVSARTGKVMMGPLQFPSDNVAREYHVTGWELQAALDTGRLGPWDVIKRLDFLKEVNFSPYVDHFFRQKAAAKAAGDVKLFTYSKLFLNSLYGKFGANPESYRIYGIVPREDRQGAEEDITLTLGRHSGPWRWTGWIGRHALMEGADPISGEATLVDSQFYNVATAASITGFVRAYLLRHIDKVEKQGGRVMYCDTDSIVFNGVDAAKVFPLSKQLGEWSHEGRFSNGAIAGKKLYAFKADPVEHAAACAAAAKKGDKPPKEWKTATKGVRLDAAAICRVAQGEEVTWEAEAPLFSLHNKKGEAPRFMHRTVRMT